MDSLADMNAFVLTNEVFGTDEQDDLATGLHSLFAAEEAAFAGEDGDVAEEAFTGVHGENVSAADLDDILGLFPRVEADDSETKRKADPEKTDPEKTDPEKTESEDEFATESACEPPKAAREIVFEDGRQRVLPRRARGTAKAESERLIIGAMRRKNTTELALRLRHFPQCITVTLNDGELTFVYDGVNYFSLNAANVALNEGVRGTKGLKKTITANAWTLRVFPMLHVTLGEYCGRVVVPFAERGNKRAKTDEETLPAGLIFV